MTPALKKLASAIFILLLGAFAVVRLRGPQGIPALMEKYRTIRQLEDQNQEIQQDNERRRTRNDELQKPDVVELEIRERLHKQRKGETTFKLPDQPPPTQ